MSKKSRRVCVECKNLRKIYGRGRCSGCYKRMLKMGLPNDHQPIYFRSSQFQTGNKPCNTGVPLSQERKEYLSKINYGKNNPRWQGKYARSHHTYRKEIERIIGRKLQQNETVHHKDGNPFNNSQENIIIFQSHSEHMTYHWKIQKEKRIDGKMKKIGVGG